MGWRATMEPVPRCSFSTWQPCCRNPHRTQGGCCCTQMTLASVGPRPFTITLQLPALLLLLWSTDPTVINHSLHKAQPAPALSHWSDDHPTVQKKWGNQRLGSSMASSPHPSPAPITPSVPSVSVEEAPFFLSKNAPEFESLLSQWLAVWPKASYFTSLYMFPHL